MPLFATMVTSPSEVFTVPTSRLLDLLSIEMAVTSMLPPALTLSVP